MNVVDMFHRFELSDTACGLRFDITLDPGKRVYCFIGENGAGKTSLLESLGAVLWWRHAMWRGEDLQGRSYAGLHRKVPFREAVGDTQIRVPNVSVDGDALKGGDSWGYINLLESASWSWTTPDEPVIDRPVVIVPAVSRGVIDGLGERAPQLVGSTLKVLAETVARSLAAVRRQAVDATAVSSWIVARALLNPSFFVGLQLRIPEVVTLLDLVQTFDPSAFERLVVREGSNTLLGLHYKDGQLFFHRTPIDRLASGHAAVLRIFQEIIASVAAWEAMRGSTDIRASDALILIDEVDAHLHPRWQGKLVRFLKQQFPNATFILTTHSPLIAHGTEEGETYELVRQGDLVTSRRIGSPRDWYLSDVYAEAFHVDVPPPGGGDDGGAQPLVDVLLEFAAKVRTYAADRQEEDKTEALRLYEQASARLPQDDPSRRSLEELRSLLG